MINFYYSRSCPHSLSLMEILTRFQTQYDPSHIQMIDVDQERQGCPPEVLGTPSLYIDSRYFYGDDAFERIASIEVQSKERQTSIGGNNPSGNSQCDLNSLDIIEEVPSIKKPSPSASSSSPLPNNNNNTTPVSAPDFDFMFNNDPIMPRKQ